jgi:hypothetical protein
MTGMDRCRHYWEAGASCPTDLTPLDWIVGLALWTALLVVILWMLSRSLKARPIPHHRTETYIAEFRRMREVVLKRDHYRCVACGTTRRLNVHHIRARAVGGSNAETNLVTLCRRHHGQAHGQRWN